MWWEEDVEAWKNWSDENEINYLKSIPGMWEKIEIAEAEPIENCSTILEWK
jgi:hypothetical protein